MIWGYSISRGHQAFGSGYQGNLTPAPLPHSLPSAGADSALWSPTPNRARQTHEVAEQGAGEGKHGVRRWRRVLGGRALREF